MSKVGERPKAGSGCDLSTAAVRFLRFTLDVGLDFDGGGGGGSVTLLPLVLEGELLLLWSGLAVDDGFLSSAVEGSLVSGGCDWRNFTMSTDKVSGEFGCTTSRLCAATPKRAWFFQRQDPSNRLCDGPTAALPKECTYCSAQSVSLTIRFVTSSENRWSGCAICRSQTVGPVGSLIA